jgi:uncharacterized Fe-S cluster-containing radical SAM superfamily protein
MNDALTLSKYMYETIAIGSTNQLPISSVCSAKCIFCSNHMNPFPIHREGFRDLDDVKKGIALLNPGAKEIRMGDSLPGRISEGEALLHPEILTILELVREKSPKSVIQVNTNGTMLTTEFIESLERFKPMRFTISYHSDNPEHWCKIFNLGMEKYTTARNCFFQLLQKEFDMQAVIVPVPNLVGYEDLENTIKALCCYTNYIIIYPPGYSRMAGPELRKTLEYDPAELSLFLSEMRKKYKINLNNMSDPLMPLRFFPYDFMLRAHNSKHRNVLWMFSSAAYKKAKKILKEFEPSVPNSHHAVNVKNLTYGGNISAAGLLMVSDFDKALQNSLKNYAKQDVKIDLVILPKIAFDRYGDDLTNRNYSELTKKYILPVWLG